MAACFDEGDQWEPVDLDEEGMAEIWGALAERLEVFVGVQFEVASGAEMAEACFLESFVGTAVVQSHAEADNLGG